MNRDCGYAKPPPETVPTVHNGLRLTAVLEEKRGTYGDDPWQQRKVEVYRRQEHALYLIATLYATDTLTSPMLLEFACPVTQLCGDIQPLR